MIHPEITVTLTPDDIKLYDRAREIGLPSIVVSMYGDRIKKLLAEERSTEREANAKMVDHILKEDGGTWGDAIRARMKKR
jgi:hypothetical protein